MLMVAGLVLVALLLAGTPVLRVIPSESIVAVGLVGLFLVFLFQAGRLAG